VGLFDDTMVLDLAKMKPKPPDIMSDDRVLLAWQRSHMANERTFLAWSRTSISLMAFGFVIERFDLFVRYLMRIQDPQAIPPSGASIALLSLLSFFLAALAIVISGFRFVRVRRHINHGEAQFSVLPDILVVVSVIVIIVMTMMLALPHIFR
jgi:putative membrane protein